MKSLILNDRQRMYYSCLSRGLAKLHFGQFAEDVVVNHLLRDIKAGFYVDIGAHQPFALSNTALLHHERGWSGINVDLDERYVAMLRAERPGDISICCAVGAEDAEMEASIFPSGAFNTLDPVRQRRFERQFPDAERRRVPVRTLPSLLDEHMPPGVSFEYLNIDVEGLDHTVLAANDWSRYRPTVISVETHGMDLGNPAASPVFQLLVSQGYALRSHVVATSVYALRPAPRGGAGAAAE